MPCALAFSFPPAVTATCKCLCLNSSVGSVTEIFRNLFLNLYHLCRRCPLYSVLVRPLFHRIIWCSAYCPFCFFTRSHFGSTTRYSYPKSVQTFLCWCLLQKEILLPVRAASTSKILSVSIFCSTHGYSVMQYISFIMINPRYSSKSVLKDVDDTKSSLSHIELWFTASGILFFSNEAIKLQNIVLRNRTSSYLKACPPALLTQVEQALPCGCGPSSPVLHQVAAITPCTRFISTVFELEHLSLFQWELI